MPLLVWPLQLSLSMPRSRECASDRRGASAPYASCLTIASAAVKLSGSNTTRRLHT